MKDNDKEKLMKVNNIISNLNKEVQQMEAQIEWFKEIEYKYIMNKTKLGKLYRNEIIDSDGELNLKKLNNEFTLLMHYSQYNVVVFNLIIFRVFH